MKLYGAIASPYVARVVMYAKLKGLDLPPLDPPGGTIKSPEYLQLNPLGKMPALEVDGKGMGESTVICEYLDDTHPGTPGMPGDPWERARTRLVGRITDLYLAPHASPIFRQVNPAKRDMAVVTAAQKEIEKAYGWLAQVMGEGPFCAGAEPTMGDCTLGTTTMMLKQIRSNGFPDLPDPVAEGRLATWWQAMEKHPVCGAVLDEFGTQFGGFVAMMAKRT